MFSRTIVLSTLSITREVVKQDCPKEKGRKSHTNISETFPGTDRLADVLTQVHAHSLTHALTRLLAHTQDLYCLQEQKQAEFIHTLKEARTKKSTYHSQ